MSESPVALSLAPLLDSANQPLLFGLVLALAVGVGLPAGALVVGAALAGRASARQAVAAGAAAGETAAGRDHDGAGQRHLRSRPHATP